MKVTPWHLVVAMLAGWLNREQDKVVVYLKEETRVLREHLRGRRIRFTDAQRRRLAAKARDLKRGTLLGLDSIVTPDTLLRWYRCLIARKYDGSAFRGSKRRGPGRPRKADVIRDLVLRMALSNPSWGYTRIRDALGNLGYEIGRSTVQKILKEHGIEPAPERNKRTSWRTFLESHWEALAACDFFSVEVLTPGGLTRYYVFFVIELRTRYVEIAGIVHQPSGAWMMQVARNLLDCETGFLLGKKYLIMDRDPLYTHQFRKLLTSAGVTPLRLPARSPDLNAYSERFVLSIKSECLDKLVLLGERHLRHAVSEFAAHYHEERNHQGLGGQLLRPAAFASSTGPIECRERLGGLLRFYHRRAA